MQELLIEIRDTLAEIRDKLTPQKPSDAPLSVREAAEFLGVGTDLIYSACKSGKLRHVRVGSGRGIIRIGKKDLTTLQTTTAPRPGLSLWTKHTQD